MPFKVWDLTAEGDSKTNATGNAQLNGKDMRCYRPNKWLLDTWATPLMGRRIGYAQYDDCVGEYFCTRTTRRVRRTDFQFSEDTLDVAISLTELPSAPQTHRIPGFLSDAFSSLTDVYNPDVLKSGGDIKIEAADAKLHVEFKVQEKKGDPTYDGVRMYRIQNELSKRLVKELVAGKSKPNCKQTPPATYPTCKYTIKFPKQIWIAGQVAFQQDMDWTPKDEITITAISTAKNTKCEQNRKAMEILSTVLGVPGPQSAWLSAAKGLGFILGKVGGSVC